MSSDHVFTWRLGSNQPLGSPTERRLNEMADAVSAEAAGRLRIEVLAGGKLGSDNAMIAEVRAGRLELYLAGANLGEFSILSEMPSLPFVFEDDAAVLAAVDGDLGLMIRDDLARNGLHAFHPFWANGFHHLTTTSRSIQQASDLRGMTIRTPVQVMPLEFFQLFGAVPKAMTLDTMYGAMRDGVVDGATDPLAVIQLLRLHEVQRYLSLTSHWWSGFLLVSPNAVWDRLPAELQALLSRAVERVAMLQRVDMATLDGTAVATLQAAGMVVNVPDFHSFRAGLEAFYARWRTAYGVEAWAVLERYAGPIG